MTGTTMSPIAIATGVDPTAIEAPTEQTLLSLSRYAQIMQIQMPHFWQMNGAKAPLTGGCDKVWDENARNLLEWTILQAEELIANELNFWPAPKFITNEVLPLGLTGARLDWYNAELETRWGYVEAFGTEKLTLVQADAGVQYSSRNSNPLAREEQALIGTAIYADLPACSRPCDVAVFFRTADGAEDAADPRYEIRPIKVDIDGDTMRITANSAMFLRPELRLLNEADCAGSSDKTAWIHNFDPTNLVSKVDVYCRTVNPPTPLVLMWDGTCHCTDVCTHRTQTGCARWTDLKLGFFNPRPAIWDGSSNIEGGPTYFGPPESVKVHYRAGYPLDTRTCRMNANLERAIVKLTNVLLPEPPCGYCDAAKVRWEHDRKAVDPLTPEAAALPWDLYSQGALEAWRLIKRLALGRGGKMGR